MSDRPNLDAIRKSLDFPPRAVARTISGYWRQCLLDVIGYAERIEQELAQESRQREFWQACARGEHDLCWADGGYCCTCGAKGGQS